MGWIGVDFDGTLAEYTTWQGPDHCGDPVDPMVRRVQRWVSEGKDVRIFTARAFPIALAEPIHKTTDLSEFSAGTDREQESVKAVQAVQKWCRLHIGHVLPITCVKDHHMDTLYDDRAVQVIKNTGQLVRTHRKKATQ